MINSIVVWLFEKTELGKMINGKKKYIGLLLSGWGGVALLLGHLAQSFPDVGGLSAAAAAVGGAFLAASKVLLSFGIPIYVAGDVHDVVKEKSVTK